MKEEVFMKKNILFLVILSFVLSFLWGGVSLGAPEPQALRDAKDPAERARIQDLIKGARAEGKLVWTAGNIEPDHAKFIAKGFKEYYDLPNLSFEYTYAQSMALISQTELLMKANRPTPDIVWVFSWSWYKSLIARGKMMRYESPKYKEYTVSNKIGNSMPGYWVSDSYTQQPMWNPAAVEKAGIKNFNPTSWWDFADPKLAKLTSMGNVARSTSYGSVAIGLKKVLGPEWFMKIAKNKPTLFSKGAQGRDWVASGEFPITITTSAKNATTIKQMGVPVRLLYPREGIVSLPFAPVILATGAHPNAAKLFIDYVRSAEGTNRLAATGVGLIYGRPGVKGPEVEREFLPDAADIKTIPMNWDLDDTEKAMADMRAWSLSIGLSY